MTNLKRLTPRAGQVWCMSKGGFDTFIEVEGVSETSVISMRLLCSTYSVNGFALYRTKTTKEMPYMSFMARFQITTHVAVSAPERPRGKK